MITTTVIGEFRQQIVFDNPVSFANYVKEAIGDATEVSILRAKVLSGNEERVTLYPADRKRWRESWDVRSVNDIASMLGNSNEVRCYALFYFDNRAVSPALLAVQVFSDSDVTSIQNTINSNLPGVTVHYLDISGEPWLYHAPSGARYLYGIHYAAEVVGARVDVERVIQTYPSGEVVPSANNFVPTTVPPIPEAPLYGKIV